jgi:hypothetical protein
VIYDLWFVDESIGNNFTDGFMMIKMHQKNLSTLFCW